MHCSQQDELIQLFTQSLQLNQRRRSTAPGEVVLQQNMRHGEQQEVDGPVHYISAHYTGTAHVRPDTTSEPPLSPPSYDQALMPEDLVYTLLQNSIDPSMLLPNQLHLFRHADYEQRLRLLELWRISPPSNAVGVHSQTYSVPTSVEREEALAAVRYEQMSSKPNGSWGEYHSRHHTPPETPISPIREAGEPAFPPAARWRAASIASSRPATRHGDAEPYIVNVYATDQAAKSSDPVFAAAPGLWQVPSFAHGSGLEDQCGMLEQVRNHDDWQRLNERIARERLAACTQGAMEDVMMT